MGFVIGNWVLTLTGANIGFVINADIGTKDKEMRNHIQNLFLMLIIAFIISIILVVLAVGKKEQTQKELDYQHDHFAPMRIHQKY